MQKHNEPESQKTQSTQLASDQTFLEVGCVAAKQLTLVDVYLLFSILLLIHIGNADAELVLLQLLELLLLSLTLLLFQFVTARYLGRTVSQFTLLLLRELRAGILEVCNALREACCVGARWIAKTCQQAFQLLIVRIDD